MVKSESVVFSINYIEYINIIFMIQIFVYITRHINFLVVLHKKIIGLEYVK